MKKLPISVCIIAKNEEKHIEECLRRLIPYGFEIIVTDTGSTDRTAELARRYTDKVYEFEWVGDFSAARNFCAAHASNNWILVLDCDEYVNSIDVRVMRMQMQKFPRSLGEIRLKSITRERGEEVFLTSDINRFYNKNFYYFDAPIHEQIRPKDRSKWDDPQNCFMLPMEVIHHGYNLSEEDMEKKQQRNLDLLYKALEDEPENAYLYFQAGQSEFVIGHIQKAIELYTRGLEYNSSTGCEYVRDMIESLAKGYAREGRFDDAVRLMDKYAGGCHNASYIYTHANVTFDSGNRLKALLLYIKATALPDSDTLGINLRHSYERIIGIYTEIGSIDMAELFREKYEACLRENERVINS